MSRLLSIYKRTLKLLPLSYREQYAEPMAQTLEDMLADESSWTAKEWVWLRAMFDVPITATCQYLQTGGVIMNTLPIYAKQSTILSSLLLVPFFILVAINTVHPFTPPWKGIGYVGVFILPVLALVIGLVTLSFLLITKKLSLRLKNLRQLSSFWALFAVPLLALVIVGFAFGHDSVHCITKGSPQHIMQCVNHS